MSARAWLARYLRTVVRSALTVSIAFVALASLAALGGAGLNAQGAPAHVRIVHGVVDAGPLDVYVDGLPALFGISLGETSGELSLSGGTHEFAVLSSGASAADALAEGTIDLRSGTEYYAALLGSSDATSVGLFRIDTRPLEPGQARFRVISGAVDADAIVPQFVGGDALSEPLGFGDASEYAVLDAGSYDLEFLDAASGTLLLSLPGAAFAEGTATDVLLIGRVSDGTLTALTEAVPVEVVQPTGRMGSIVSGTCAQPGDAVADLGLVQPGQGESVGAEELTTTVSQGYGLAPVSFTTLINSPHAVTVREDASAGGEAVACGEIAGRLTDTGALVIALDGPGAATVRGIAVLAPSVDNPDATGVSIFLAGATANATVVGTPSVENG